MHPRVKAFHLFLVFAVVSSVLAASLTWFFFIHLHVVDTSVREWRPARFMWIESLSAIAACLIATWVVARLATRL